ncbi:MAG: hypothetical protein M1837_005048 [Sclerophora amabilis]|nr:MAG: hypothetical protein M1837_005048 [Sclerophora amabilis]
MDPFSADGELMNMQNAFYQGQYDKVTEFDTSSFSTSNSLPARILSLRAQLATGHAEDVIAELEGDDDTPDLAAVKAFAQYEAGNQSEALRSVEQLAEASSENASVQILGGTILQAEGKSEEALALLGRHQGSLEAVALIVQIQLQQNRTDLALKEVQAAKRWAQDSLLVNIAESWVGLRVGGEKYQDAFYVFEELASAPATSASLNLVSQAVAELHLGRLGEAEAALQQAVEKDPKDVNAIANTIVWSVIAGKDPQESISSLQSTSPEHPFLRDLQEKSALFDKAAAKYSAKVTV